MVKGKFATACRAVLFVVNILFWVLGVAILGVGIYAEIERNSSEKIAIIGNTGSYAPIAMIIIGVIVFFIGFCGCCGAFKEHRGLLVIYASLVFVIFILQIAAGIYGFVQRDQLRDVILDGLKETIDKYMPLSSSDSDTKSWDFVQREVGCCGIENYTSWDNATHWVQFTGGAPGVYPGSCCVNATEASNSTMYNISTCALDQLGQVEGCYTDILSTLRRYWRAVAGVAVGVAVFELIVILMACVLQRAIQTDSYTAV